VRTGAEYLESLRDGREVWVQGERVRDVTTHPAFAPLCRELVRLYDLQAAPGTREAMTAVDPDGNPISCSYLMPRTGEDLLRRRRNAEIWARESFGLLGRYPDFCASMAVGLSDTHAELAGLDPALAANAVAYHRHAARHDLCLSHGLHDPAMDKSLRPEHDPDRCLRIVGERDDGLVVSGARFVTLGPLSNDIIVVPSYPLNEREAEFAVWFAIPCDAPGLKQVCRQPFGPHASVPDHPASARFDEPDSLAIFDAVLVPWERVFLARQPVAAGRLFRSGIMRWAAYSSSIQLLAKLELFVGVAHLLATTSGMHTRPGVMVELGELVMYAQIFQSIVRAAEIDHVRTPGGHVAPGPTMHKRALIALISERLVSILEHIGTSSLIFTPTDADRAVPALKPYLDLYGRGRETSAEARTRLCRLAWDLTGGGFGGRQQLYERLHSGDPATIMTAVYQSYDKSQAIEMVDRLLGDSRR
jgi:4-hydroxyphenylacetate 3-monooxygenase/anthranilate 3-monooxygenase (FAD)/4-hydroxyphenylacetate 3-monooxygenase